MPWKQARPRGAHVAASGVTGPRIVTSETKAKMKPSDLRAANRPIIAV
jgi:hypothetical protein